MDVPLGIEVGLPRRNWIIPLEVGFHHGCTGLVGKSTLESLALTTNSRVFLQTFPEKSRIGDGYDWILRP